VDLDGQVELLCLNERYERLDLFGRGGDAGVIADRPLRHHQHAIDRPGSPVEKLGMPAPAKQDDLGPRVRLPERLQGR
jgi:hypothetical protein